MAGGKLSFGRNPRATGLARVAEPHASVRIKLDGRQVGLIVPPSNRGHLPDNQWRVRLSVKREPTVDQPAPFAWIGLSWRGSTEAEGREFVTRMWDQIRQRDLHQFER